jgi:tetratricopeptide (TPR) repeat protein
VQVLAALGLAALSGCTALMPPPPKPPLPPDLPTRIELTAVPFFAQEQYQCGPAALASILTAAGVPRAPEALVDQVYLPAREGSLQPEMLAATRRAGLLPYVLAPRLTVLLQELAAGHPVLVLQNPGRRWWPQWHYAVVVGYRLDEHQLILRSGTHARMAIDLEDFDRTWERAGRWAFVALRPDVLPATVQQAAYLNAAASLERVDKSAARTAYLTALRAWPSNLAAQLGLGNIAYALGHLEEARDAYRLASQAHAASGDAWNNLAQALIELGARAQALDAARRAVATGGPRATLYEATLASALALP